MRISVLGPLEVHGALGAIEIAAPKQRAVLTVLALRAGRPVGLAELMDGVWGDEAPPTAARSLQSHISRLRSAVGRDVVRSEPGGYVLALSPDSVDVTRFEALVAEGTRNAQEERWEAAAKALAAAGELWRGEALAELGDGALAASALARLTELREAAEEQCAEAVLRSGRATDALAELEALTKRAPLRERRWELLVEALYVTGRQADALRAYQRARDVLAEVLGVEPGLGLREIEARVLAHDPTLDAAAQAPPTTIKTAASELPTGTVTLVLTDIEGSTRSWDDHPEAMVEAVARHTEVIEAVVIEHGGHLLKAKGEGDSTFSVFAEADDAVRAALVVRDRLAEETWPGGLDLPVRIGVATGPCELRNGDYFGPHVNRAARVRGKAAGGEVLLASTTYLFTADSALRDLRVTDLGQVELRGLSRPEQIWRVDAPAPDAQLEHEIDPASWSDLGWVPTSMGGFVGRADEWRRLLGAWESTLDGRRRAVLLAGEPGIGKSHLAGQLALRAVDSGGVVLFGRCPPDGTDRALPQAFTGYLDRAHESHVAGVLDALGSTASDLVRLAPTLADRVPSIAWPMPLEADESRRLITEAFTGFVTSLAAQAPVLLILDDLHWGGPTSVAALGRLVSGLADDVPVMVVGTYRDTDLERRHPLAATLADVRSSPSVERIRLDGLDADGVVAFVETAAEHALDDETMPVARAVATETGGNPLFVGEVLAHLVESGVIVRREGRWVPTRPVAELPIPEGLAEVIGRRLDGLSDDANTVLQAAAVMGPRFEHAVIERVVAIGSSVLDVLDEATLAGLTSETDTYGTYEFAHAVIRTCLVDELSVTRRVGLHWSIGTALHETRDEGDPEAAHHLVAGRLAGNPETAGQAALAAARTAIEQFDTEACDRWIERGLECVGPRPTRLRFELQLTRAQVLGASGWHGDRGRAAGVAALDTAVELGDVELIGRAAVGHWFQTFGTEAPEIIAAFERALSRAVGGPDWVLGRINASLANLIGLTGSSPRWRDHLALALRHRDPSDTLGALQLYQVMVGLATGHPWAAAQVMPVIDELGATVDDADLDVVLQLMRLGAQRAHAMLIGDLDAWDGLTLDSQLTEADAVGPRTLALESAVAVGVRASRGEVADAARDFDSTMQLVAQYVAPEAAATHAVYVQGLISMFDGTAVEHLPMLEAMAQTYDGVAWAAVLAYVLAEAGRCEDAVAVINERITGDFGLANANSHTHELLLLSSAAARCGHLDPLPRLRDEIEVYPDFLASNWLGCWGGGRHALGWIAAALGEHDRARAEFERAIAQFDRCGMRGFHAWAVLDLAELDHTIGDDASATRRAVAAREEAQPLGAKVIVHRADELLAEIA